MQQLQHKTPMGAELATRVQEQRRLYVHVRLWAFSYIARTTYEAELATVVPEDKATHEVPTLRLKDPDMKEANCMNPRFATEIEL